MNTISAKSVRSVLLMVLSSLAAMVLTPNSAYANSVPKRLCDNASLCGGPPAPVRPPDPPPPPVIRNTFNDVAPAQRYQPDASSPVSVGPSRAESDALEQARLARERAQAEARETAAREQQRLRQQEQERMREQQARQQREQQEAERRQREQQIAQQRRREEQLAEQRRQREAQQAADRQRQRDEQARQVAQRQKQNEQLRQQQLEQRRLEDQRRATEAQQQLARNQGPLQKADSNQAVGQTNELRKSIRSDMPQGKARDEALLAIRRSEEQAALAKKKTIELQNLKVNHGLAIAGSPQALQRAGYKTEAAKGTAGDSAFIATSPTGQSRLYVDPTSKKYRKVAEDNGLKTDGVDIDHAAAKKVNPHNDPTLLSSSEVSVNRSHGSRERYAEAGTRIDGVTYAGPEQIRKLNGYKPEDLSKRGLKDTFDGVAGDANKALDVNAKPN